MGPSDSPPRSIHFWLHVDCDNVWPSDGGDDSNAMRDGLEQY